MSEPRNDFNGETVPWYMRPEREPAEPQPARQGAPGSRQADDGAAQSSDFVGDDSAGTEILAEESIFVAKPVFASSPPTHGAPGAGRGSTRMSVAEFLASSPEGTLSQWGRSTPAPPKPSADTEQTTRLAAPQGGGRGPRGGAAARGEAEQGERPAPRPDLPAAAWPLAVKRQAEAEVPTSPVGLSLAALRQAMADRPPRAEADTGAAAAESQADGQPAPDAGEMRTELLAAPSSFAPSRARQAAPAAREEAAAEAGSQRPAAEDPTVARPDADVTARLAAPLGPTGEQPATESPARPAGDDTTHPTATPEPATEPPAAAAVEPEAPRQGDLPAEPAPLAAASPEESAATPAPEQASDVSPAPQGERETSAAAATTDAASEPSPAAAETAEEGPDAATPAANADAPATDADAPTAGADAEPPAPAAETLTADGPPAFAPPAEAVADDGPPAAPGETTAAVETAAAPETFASPAPVHPIATPDAAPAEEPVVELPPAAPPRSEQAAEPADLLPPREQAADHPSDLNPGVAELISPPTEQPPLAAAPSTGGDESSPGPWQAETAVPEPDAAAETPPRESVAAPAEVTPPQAEASAPPVDAEPVPAAESAADEAPEPAFAPEPAAPDQADAAATSAQPDTVAPPTAPVTEPLAAPRRPAPAAAHSPAAAPQADSGGYPLPTAAPTPADAAPSDAWMRALDAEYRRPVDEVPAAESAEPVAIEPTEPEPPTTHTPTTALPGTAPLTPAAPSPAAEAAQPTGPSSATEATAAPAEPTASTESAPTKAIRLTEPPSAADQPRTAPAESAPTEPSPPAEPAAPTEPSAEEAKEAGDIDSTAIRRYSLLSAARTREPGKRGDVTPADLVYDDAYELVGPEPAAKPTTTDKDQESARPSASAAAPAPVRRRSRRELLAAEHGAPPRTPSERPVEGPSTHTGKRPRLSSPQPPLPDEGPGGGPRVDEIAANVAASLSGATAPPQWHSAADPASPTEEDRTAPLASLRAADDTLVADKGLLAGPDLAAARPGSGFAATTRQAAEEAATEADVAPPTAPRGFGLTSAATETLAAEATPGVEPGAETAAEDSPSWQPLGPGDVKPRRQSPAPAVTRPEAVLDGASVQPAPLSRSSAHWWSLLLTLVLAPLGWGLVWDAANRMLAATNLQLSAQEFAVTRSGALPLVELLVGLVLLAVVFLAGRWSAAGLLVVGAVWSVAGLLVLLLPELLLSPLEPLINDMITQNSFWPSIAYLILVATTSGQMLFFGVVMLLTGLVSHGARRQGQQEQASLDALQRRQQS